MAEESSDVPKELIESVRDVIGRKIKISVKKKVKLETKGDKVDNKILCPVLLFLSPEEKLLGEMFRGVNDCGFGQEQVT
ncbi:hypothetical protein DUI87_07901 [Hirundo rustica rustica]|uniref:Uncharacterized protein n=1 Tax=Hirundo rustica rustica TaxID=333673 RepID=A0A3M0KR32_HIRRU|nr:hypothetical protein DUI87_07901 [Hirundo rustica rustica]